MKKYILFVFTLSIVGSIHAQRISQSKVPSVVLNNFNVQFPKATDVEWEMQDGLYLVDFELDRSIDHKIWYNPSGEVVKHREEIAKKALPATILSAIYTKFKGYKIDDAEKVTVNGKTSYEVELDAPLKKEWKVTLDESGTILNKIAD